MQTQKKWIYYYLTKLQAVVYVTITVPFTAQFHNTDIHGSQSHNDGLLSVVFNGDFYRHKRFKLRSSFLFTISRISLLIDAHILTFTAQTNIHGYFIPLYNRKTPSEAYSRK